MTCFYLLFVVFFVILIVPNATGIPDELARDKRNNGGRYCNWWCRRSRCTPYNKAASVCCYPYGRQGQCCSQWNLHAFPQCGSVTDYFEHPCACEKYFECFNGKLEVKQCPYRGAWNQQTKSCEMVDTTRPAVCQGKRYRCIWRLPMQFKKYSFVAVNGSQEEAKFDNEKAPFDTAMNMLLFTSSVDSSFSLKIKFDKRIWWYVECVNDVCAKFNQDRTYWKVFINDKEIKSGLSSVIPRMWGAFRIRLELAQVSAAMAAAMAAAYDV